VMTEHERRLVAFHESGHAVIGYYLQNADTVHKVTIIPRGMAGGYTVTLPKEDRYFMTRQEMLDKICGLLGGRVAEEIIFGEISTGASNDLERVTGIARSMVTEYGMSQKLGPMRYGSTQGQVFLGKDISSEQNYSDHVAYDIDEEMKQIVEECHQRTLDLLNEKRTQLDNLANLLLDKETIDEEQIRAVMEDRLDELQAETDAISDSDATDTPASADVDKESTSMTGDSEVTTSSSEDSSQTASETDAMSGESQTIDSNENPDDNQNNL
jgi:cell division protease FtsH